MALDVTMERKACDNDNEFEDDGNFNSNELNEEGDFDDEHDGEEEEESENAEEDREEVGREENGDGQNDNKDAEMEEVEKEYMNLRNQEQFLRGRTLKWERRQSDAGAQADGEHKLLDDSQFYQQLLKEIFETIDPASSG